MEKYNTYQAAEYLGMKERKLRTSRINKTIDGVKPPKHCKDGIRIYYTKQALDLWLSEREKAVTECEVYIVWNEDKTEGYATTSKALATSVQKGDWDACGNNPQAKSFCDNYSESELTNVDLRITTCL